MHNISFVILASGSALAACLLLIKVLSYSAPSFGLIDFPDARKRHSGSVPVIGGLAMFGAVIVGSLMLPLTLSHYALLAALLLLIGVGLWDDRHSLPTLLRFLAQAGAALLLTWSGAVLHDLGDLLGQGDVVLRTWTMPVTVFCVIGVINALNMTDGLDGLAGGISLIAVVWLLVLTPASTAGATVALLWVLAAALVGFLGYNLRHPWRSRAAIFMGDAGSMMLGGVLAWAFITLSQGSSAERAFTPITAVWILSLPLIDTVSIMIQRALSGRSPFAADRQHLHHMLLDMGFSEAQTTAILLAIALLFGAVGVTCFRWGVSESVMFYAFLGLFSLYFFGLYGRRRRSLRLERSH